MNRYSYSELQNMQQKAMERVREMKRSSDAVTQTAQRELEFEQKKSIHNENIKPVTTRVTNMPPNFPQNSQYPSFKDFFREEQVKNPPKSELNSNFIENLFAEPDKAILLGLIMLLKSEGADEILIMALMYILS